MSGTTSGRRGAAAAVRPRERVPPLGAARPRPHLCFVAPHAWPVLSGDPEIPVVGGAEVQQSLLARLFAERGYRVSMICLDFGQPDRAQVEGVTVHKAYRPQAGVPVLRFLHPRLTAMWRALREVDADIYYCRTAGMLVGVLAQFCRRHGRRSVYAAASDMDFAPDVGGQIRHARDRWLYRRGLARVDRIVAQNEVQRAGCRATYGREALVIPSLYRPARASAPQPVKDRVLWVGTLRSGKRPELLLELAARLPHRRFVMIGGPAADEPEFFARIRERAASLANVEFTGFLPLARVEPWFDRARVLLNTSRYEGMPNTFLQAWARGVPTLATVDVGAPVQQVFRGPQDGALAIERLFESQLAWKSASERCRQHFARTHSEAQVLQCYERLFQELIA